MSNTCEHGAKTKSGQTGMMESVQGRVRRDKNPVKTQKMAGNAKNLKRFYVYAAPEENVKKHVNKYQKTKKKRETAV